MRVLRFIALAFTAAVAASFVAGSLGGHVALAGPGPVTVLAGQGVTFAQVDFTWPGATTLNSDTGEMDVDVATLQAATGMSSGYLSVETSAGWVVQNIPVDASYPYPSISTGFALGSTSGVDITSLSAEVELSSGPTTIAPSGTPTAFSVGDTEFNGQGVCDDESVGCSVVPGSPPPPAPAAINFQLGGLFQIAFQPNHQNVETALGQCGPASVANSLQWLKDTFGIALRDANIKGVAGAPANSLVGQLDLAMNRPANGFASYLSLLRGKLGYLAGSGLGNTVNVKHQGVLGNADFPAFGLTSKAQGTMVTTAFIRSELKAGEDVELTYRWIMANGRPMGHSVEVVGAGVILGIPWIAYRSDWVQGDNTQGTERIHFSFLNQRDAQGNLMTPILVNEANRPAAVFVTTASPKLVNGTPVPKKPTPTRTPTPTPSRTQTSTPTPTPTATATPSGVIVGGVSLDPRFPGSSGSDAWLLTEIAGIAAAAVVLGSATWYLRRRRVR